jgi:hypothetical protein
MKRFGIVALAAMSLALVVSCVSTPPPEQPQSEAPLPAPAAPEKELQEARDLRVKVDTFALGDYQPDTYAQANESLAGGETAYGSDNATAKSLLDAAIGLYQKVIDDASPAYYAAAQAPVEAAKAAADELKAAVAVKDEYAAANALYVQALQERDQGDITSASVDFASARAKFEAVTATAQEKKTNALQELSGAEDDQKAAEQKASDALAELQTEGITPSEVAAGSEP